MEAMKTIIHDQDLPRNLWDEAYITTVDVQNRIGHRAFGNKNPE